MAQSNIAATLVAVVLSVLVVADTTNGDTRFAQKSDVLLYGSTGHPTAYIDSDDSSTVFLWSGEPSAYLVEELLYGFNGQHLGWFRNGVIRDLEGRAVGYTRTRLPTTPKNPMVRGPQRTLPAKTVRQPAQLRPPDSVRPSPVALEKFLRAGRR